jgi:2-keto-3-deoxy-6-phosphogluconate aldolase
MGFFNTIGKKMMPMTGLEIIITGGVAGAAAGSYMDNSTGMRGLGGGLLMGSSIAAARGVYRGGHSASKTALMVGDAIGSAYFGAKIFDKR